MFLFFLFCFFKICAKVVYLLSCLTVRRLVPDETATISVHILCSPYSHAPVYNFIQS